MLKENKKNFIYLLITITFIIITIINGVSLCVKIYNIKQQKKIVEQKLSMLVEEEQYLKLEVEKLNDPDYVARYAREKYLFSKDGEFNIRIQ
ncbi:MAG: septum formation initiator family protein [Bacilli bacterium]|nr:septum formation initiator family protein [Bacilli bacterium]